MKISYEIYQDKIVLKNGDQEQTAMLRNIEVSVQQDFLGKQLNYGTLIIKPLVEKPSYLYMISHPEKYKETIQKLAGTP